MKVSDPEIQKYIFEHEHDDETKLILRSKEMMGVPTSLIADQIKARRKARTKLPLFYKTPGIVYPPSINLEQSSSEATAIYKRKIIEGLASERNAFCDLTCGFGIDSFFISSAFKHCDVVEPNESLISIARHNHHLLGADSIRYHNTTAEEFLKNTVSNFDVIYVDPSRRGDVRGKVFKLSDTEPNPVDLAKDTQSGKGYAKGFHSKDLSEPFAFPSRIHCATKYLIIKASPLLDLQQGIRELQSVEKIHVVAVDNEVKEVLFLCSQNGSTDPEIICVDIDTSEFRFLFTEERDTTTSLSHPLQFIYEPNASIMKGGAFKSVAARFNLKKMDVNTHLYTSEEKVENFPGRTFRIVDHVKPDKSLKEKFPASQANILLRNYPITVEELKKKTGLKEGGELYLIGGSYSAGKFLVKAEKTRGQS